MPKSTVEELVSELHKAAQGLAGKAKTAVEDAAALISEKKAELKTAYEEHQKG
jgi:hypothetical protein